MYCVIICIVIELGHGYNYFKNERRETKRTVRYISTGRDKRRLNTVILARKKKKI